MRRELLVEVGKAGAQRTARRPWANPFQMQEENRRLKRELARVKEEDGILLKANAFSAGRRPRRGRSSHS